MKCLSVILPVLIAGLGCLRTARAVKNILIVGTSTESNNQKITDSLYNTGRFETVDFYDATLSTPTLEDLLAYDSVLFFSDNPYFNSTAMGDVAADYYDQYRCVVTSNFNFLEGSIYVGYSLGGRWESEGYGPIAVEPNTIVQSNVVIGNIVNPSDPIFAGVNTLYYDGASIGATITMGAQVLATWSDGTVFVAVKDRGPQWVTVVAINMIPLEKEGSGSGYTGDGALLFANALEYCSPRPPCEMNVTCFHGTCDSEGFCICDEGYSGRTCSQYWPWGCFNGVNCDIGTCDCTSECKCYGDWGGQHCDVYVEGGACKEDQTCFHGICNMTSNECECFPDWSGPTCEIYTAKGCNPKINCYYGDCFGNVCQCQMSHSGPYCNVPRPSCHPGSTDCMMGTCHDGECLCDPQYCGENCDIWTTYFMQ